MKLKNLFGTDNWIFL